MYSCSQSARTRWIVELDLCACIYLHISQLLFVAAVVRYVYVRLCHIANKCEVKPIAMVKPNQSQMRPTHGATIGATTTDHVLPVVENTYM